MGHGLALLLRTWFKVDDSSHDAVFRMLFPVAAAGAVFAATVVLLVVVVVVVKRKFHSEVVSMVRAARCFSRQVQDPFSAISVEDVFQVFETMNFCTETTL